MKREFGKSSGESFGQIQARFWLLNPGDRYCSIGPAVVSMMKGQESSQLTVKLQAEIAKLTQGKKREKKKAPAKPISLLVESAK